MPSRARRAQKDAIPTARLPSPLATPSVLRQILIHCSDPTLTSCMRVSHLFIDIAGPLLYREIRYPQTINGHFLLDYDKPTRYRATRTTKASINLKRQLLAHVLAVEVCRIHGLRHWETPYGLNLLPRLRTLRIITPWWCPCRDTHRLDFYDINLGTVEARKCEFARSLRADKLVFAALREYTVSSLLQRLKPALQSCKKLAVIISPDTLCCTVKVAETIRTVLEEFTVPPSLRVILAPPSARIRNATRLDDAVLARSHPAHIEDILDFCRSVVSTKYFTTIYLAQEFAPDPYSPSNGINRLLARETVQNAILDSFGPRTTVWPAFAIKTRAEYLAEGVTDEVDPKQIDQWQDLERQARISERVEAEIQAYASVATNMLRLERERRQAEADEVASSGVVADWFAESEDSGGYSGVLNGGAGAM